MWSEKRIKEFQKILMDWYDDQAHDFPWRRTKDPYKIWISEIMLQQTQVSTVIPYFEQFINKFPTIKDLASAPEEEVLKSWEGLGYYSRARNLKKAAEQIMIKHDGVFPNEPEDIIQLMGIGPYTTGAIGSMAFDLPLPAIDGNLMRVLSRLFEVDLDITKVKNRKVFETVALYLIDEKRPGDFNQALMDLGRTVCTPRNYFPAQSPVKDFNASYLNETWHLYPVKKKKNKPKMITYLALIIKNGKGEYLLNKRPSKGLLADMWTFPLIEVNKIATAGDGKLFEQKILENISLDEEIFINNYVYENIGISINVEDQTIGVVEHIFTHLIWKISIFEGLIVENADDEILSEEYHWVSEEKFNEYTFPTVQKKLWDKSHEITLF